MSLQKLRIIKEGKSKKLYWVNSNTALMVFKDDITAFNGAKHDVIDGKGKVCAAISARLFEILNKSGIKTHFIRYVPPRSHEVRILEMIPLEVVCRNIAFGSLLKRLPLFKPKESLSRPIVEFFLKDDSLNDPFLSEEYVSLLNILSHEEISYIKQITLKVNEILRDFLHERELLLVDFKLEFGRDEDGNLVIGDELTCDTMRLWDIRTGEILDKDLYRMGKPLDVVWRGYLTCYERIVLR